MLRHSGRESANSLGLILSVTLLLAVLGRIKTLETLPSIYLWMAYPALGSIATYAIFSFLNRKRSIHVVQALVVLFVAFQSAYAALFINDTSPFKLYTVGFNEEFFKILPVLLMAIYFPSIIRTKKDGIIYGGLAGVGFNIIEISSYIVNFMQQGESVWSALWVHSTRLAVLGFGSHILWSAFIGMSLGMVAESRHQGFRRWVPFIGIYLLVAILHSAFDLGLVGIFLLFSYLILDALVGSHTGAAGFESAIETMGQPGIFRNSMILEHFVYSFVFIVIMIRKLFVSAADEQKTYVTELAEEGSDVITEAEQSILAAESRWGYRRYPHLSKTVSRKIVKLQNLLAMLKQTIRKDGGDPATDATAAVLRNRILALRQEA